MKDEARKWAEAELMNNPEEFQSPKVLDELRRQGSSTADTIQAALWIKALLRELVGAEAKRRDAAFQEALDVLGDMVSQHCRESKAGEEWLCSGALSANRDAMLFLVEHGRMELDGPFVGRMGFARFKKDGET